MLGAIGIGDGLEGGAILGGDAFLYKRALD
jgi:hypothetical protein